MGAEAGDGVVRRAVEVVVVWAMQVGGMHGCSSGRGIAGAVQAMGWGAAKAATVLNVANTQLWMSWLKY